MVVGRLNRRLLYIDAVKGLAILFMVQVHTASIVPPESLTLTHPLTLLSAAIGGLAAPLFVLISGWGAQSAASRRIGSGTLMRWLVVRVSALIIAQVIVNLILPQRFHWYTPGVLTLLAACTLLSPLTCRIVNIKSAQIPLFGMLLLSPVAISPNLEIAGWWEMVVVTSPSDWLARLLIDGTYPLFPWLALFVVGQTVRARGVRGGDSTVGEGENSVLHWDLLLTCALPLVVVVAVVDGSGPPFQTYGPALITFFPASPFFVLASAMTSLFVIEGVRRCRNHETALLKHLADAGRLSLSIYVAHFGVLRILAELFDGRLPLVTSFSLTFLHIGLWLVVARLWRIHAPEWAIEGVIRRLSV